MRVLYSSSSRGAKSRFGFAWRAGCLCRARFCGAISGIRISARKTTMCREPMPARSGLSGRPAISTQCGAAKFKTLGPGLPRKQRIAWSQAVHIELFNEPRVRASGRADEPLPGRGADGAAHFHRGPRRCCWGKPARGCQSPSLQTQHSTSVLVVRLRIAADQVDALARVACRFARSASRALARRIGPRGAFSF